MTDKVAYIVDGGFFTKRFKKIYREFPSAEQVESYVKDIQKYISSNYCPSHSEIYRIFYYDSKPLMNKTIKNPIDSSDFNLGDMESFKENNKLQQNLKRKSYFALRFGTLSIPEARVRGEKISNQWTVNNRKLMSLSDRYIKPRDLVPNIKQKGVDMRMGLDIAIITSKKLCTKIVLLSGDADMIPAMKQARKEGVQVFLHTFDNNVSPDMYSHSDIVIKRRDLKPSVQSQSSIK